MIEQIPLDRIQPNPYQTRESEDAEHIQKLARSIAEQGLLQVPTGRRVDGGVQLAFGHSRFAAYRFLKDAGNPGFEALPVNLVALSDLEMFEMAVAENHERKDLNPLEEAKAMAVYRDAFGKTSAQIGELFHLSDSAVRNKMRLLGLPEEVKAAVSGGLVTEGAARSLVSFFALPAEIRQAWEASERNRNYGQNRALIEQALAGEIGAEEITQRLARMQESNSEKLSSAWWKYDDELKSNAVQAATCRACGLRHEERCLDRKCFQEKKRIYINNSLYLAGQAAGIKALEEDRRGYGDHTRLGVRYSWEAQSKDEDKIAAIIKGGCENLRLWFDDGPEPQKDAAHCVEGYPRAVVVCRNHSGTCRCTAGYDVVKQQAVKQAAKAPEAMPAEAPQAAAELTAEELRKAAADQLKARRAENEIAVKLMDLAGELLGAAAVEYNDRALIYLLGASGLFSSTPDLSKRFTDAARAKAMAFFRTNLEYVSLAGWLTHTNKVLAACALPQLSPEDAGRTAAEMMAKAQADRAEAF